MNLAETYPEDFDRVGYRRAPAGLFHGYDLGKLLIAALKTVDLDQPAQQIRADLILALRQIDGPVEGLLRIYERPFSTPEGMKNSTAHEALSIHDFCMARFDQNDRIVPMRTAS
jgi:branched-chain amino acid transport system substrate-binding protein